MSAYDELVERCERAALNAGSGRRGLSRAVIRNREIIAALAEVACTLENVTPEMVKAWQDDEESTPYSDWTVMLRASPLFPPEPPK